MNYPEEQLTRFFGGRRFIDSMSRLISHHSLGGMSEHWIARECAFGITCPYFDFAFVDEIDRSFWVDAMKRISVVQTNISLLSRWDVTLDEPRNQRLYRVIITTQEIKKALGEDRSGGRVAVFATDHLKDRAARQAFWDAHVREWIRAKVVQMIP